MTIVLKLGGSVITEKDRPETLDGRALDAACDAIAAVHGHGVADAGASEATADAAGSADLVLVHGGGSFGHHHAGAHGVTTTAGTHDAGAVLAIHGAMTTLNGFVLERLRDRGVPAVPVHPWSAAHRDQAGDLHLPTGQVATMLAERFVPVLHGDVVAHAGAGATIVSGDELVVELAGALGADRVGLCSSVDGVLDADGDVVPRISSLDDVADALGGSDVTDVTGGMAGKVSALLAMDTPAAIFGVDDLDAFLAGEEPGTRVE